MGVKLSVRGGQRQRNAYAHMQAITAGIVLEKMKKIYRFDRGGENKTNKTKQKNTRPNIN